MVVVFPLYRQGFDAKRDYITFPRSAATKQQRLHLNLDILIPEPTLVTTQCISISSGISLQ